MSRISPADRTAVMRLIDEMEAAWNAGDAARYASTFAFDGDQVNIFGAHLKDREEVARRHDKVFKTIFLKSHVRFQLIDAREVSADVILARVRTVVDVPGGPLVGSLETLASLVFRKTNSDLELVTFHNTRVSPDAHRE
jgi:uncharacterized protein (TIGR02246 family)